MKAAPKTIDAYLAQTLEPARTTLNKVRATIRSVVPAEATEAISYSMPAFKYKGNLVGFAAFKKHCSFFPMSAKLLDDFADELGDLRTSKGTVQFPLDKPLRAALLKKIVKVRVAQNDQRNGK